MNRAEISRLVSLMKSPQDVVTFLCTMTESFSEHEQSIREALERQDLGDHVEHLEAMTASAKARRDRVKQLRTPSGQAQRTFPKRKREILAKLDDRLWQLEEKGRAAKVAWVIKAAWDRR